MVAIALVCHNGDLEIKAAFLIYSLRKYLKGKYSIYVGIPEENRHISAPSPMFLSFCKSQNAITYVFENPYVAKKETLVDGDVVSNKIFACQHNFEEKYVVFLDTDTVLLREFDVKDLVDGSAMLKLKPANRANIRQWQEIYDTAKIKIPIQRVFSGIDKVEMPPYFNSGVIVMNSKIIKKLTTYWQKYFLWLSEEKASKELRFPLFHRDQIALALAIADIKIEFELLRENFNFPVRGKKIRDKVIPYIVHYHNPYSIYFEKNIKKEFREFICQYPELINTATSLWKALFNESYLREKSTAWIEYFRFNKYRLSRWIVKMFVL
jgi:hypothetical protein